MPSLYPRDNGGKLSETSCSTLIGQSKIPFKPPHDQNPMHTTMKMSQTAYRAIPGISEPMSSNSSSPFPALELANNRSAVPRSSGNGDLSTNVTTNMQRTTSYETNYSESGATFGSRDEPLTPYDSFANSPAPTLSVLNEMIASQAQEPMNLEQGVDIANLRWLDADKFM